MDRDLQIRDKLVIGLLDKEVCEKLQLKTDLTLEKAKEIDTADQEAKCMCFRKPDVVKFKKKERYKDQQSKCQKNNHFGKMCRNKQIQELEGIASSTNYFIRFVGAEIPPWTTSIEIL